MAGGKITRIVGKKFSQECENLSFYQDNFTLMSNNPIKLTTDAEMIYGSPKSIITSKYFIKGWWSDLNDNPITEAQVEDGVRFHIETSIPEGHEITFKIFDYDGILANDELTLEDWYPHQKLTIDKNGQAIIEWLLGMGSASLIISEKIDSKIELFVRCTYMDETIDLADTSSTWLNVTLPPIRDKIVFVKASEGYELPEMYDAKTGDIFYITKKNKDYVDGLKDIYDQFLHGDRLSVLEEKGYLLAVRRLKAGTMMMTSGKVTSTRRLYKYKISNIDGTFKDEIIMGVNFRGTKGINQLEAISSIGVSKYLKFAGKIVTVSGTLLDLADIVNAAANNELPSIPWMPPFVTMEVDKWVEEFKEETAKDWYNKMRSVIPKGIEATKDFFHNYYIDKEYKMEYKFIELTEEAMHYLLIGNIEKIDTKNPQILNNVPLVNIESLSEIGDGYNTRKNCGIIVQTVYDQKDVYDRHITTHYIHVLFLLEFTIKISK